LQQRGMRRPREIRRRQMFLPSLVLQKNADDGVTLRASHSKIKAKSILLEERVDFILLLLSTLFLLRDAWWGSLSDFKMSY
jgi:hypothetical protein